MTNLEWRYLPSCAALTKHEVRKTTNTIIPNSSFLILPRLPTPRRPSRQAASSSAPLLPCLRESATESPPIRPRCRSPRESYPPRPHHGDRVAVLRNHLEASKPEIRTWASRHFAKCLESYHDERLTVILTNSVPDCVFPTFFINGRRRPRGSCAVRPPR